MSASKMDDDLILYEIMPGTFPGEIIARWEHRKGGYVYAERVPLPESVDVGSVLSLLTKAREAFMENK